MRICIILSLVLLMGVMSPVGAAELKGQVRLNEVNGPPLAGVKIDIVTGGANPTESGTSGKFTVMFPAKTAGEVIELSVRKDGYVVVNSVQLRLSLPKDAEAEPLIIILCREINREEMTRRFYRLRSLEAIEGTYLKRIRDLELKNQATVVALAALREERDQAQAEADKAAVQFAVLKPEDSSGVYQEAMALFAAGNIEEALQILEEAKLARAVERAKQLRKDADKALTQAVQAYLLRAKLLSTQFQFADAEKAYRAAIAEVPESFDAQFGLADLFQSLNRYHQSFRTYQNALDIARRRGSKYELAKTLNSLGILQHDLHEPEKARQSYEEALQIYRELATEAPETCLGCLASVLNNLGFLLVDLHEPEKARQSYEEALRIRRDLASRAPETFLPQVASTLLNLGNFHTDRHETEAARQALSEALLIYRNLAIEHPDLYLRDLAATLASIGNLEADLHNYQAGRQAYDEALNIFRKLATRSPETYLPEVACTLNSLGNVEADLHNNEAARKAYSEALDILRKLAAGTPEVYLGGVANVLNNLGLLQADTYQSQAARQAYEEALRIRRELAVGPAESYLPAVAQTLYNLALLYRTVNEVDAARQASKEALEIYEKFAVRSPGRFAGDLDKVKNLVKQLETDTRVTK